MKASVGSDAALRCPSVAANKNIIELPESSKIILLSEYKSLEGRKLIDGTLVFTASINIQRGVACFYRSILNVVNVLVRNKHTTIHICISETICMYIVSGFMFQLHNIAILIALLLISGFYLH